jgi:hypothetical protein
MGWFSTRLLVPLYGSVHIGYAGNYFKSKTGSNLKRVLFSGLDSKEAAISKAEVTYCALEEADRFVKVRGPVVV